MNPKNSEDLFNKIRSQFSNIRLGDENGAATADPSTAVFFEFDFEEDADTFGSVSISLADGENMKVYYNRDLVSKIDEDSRDEWYAFLKELKDFAVEHQLRFDVRDITKNNLTKQDYENLADTNKTVNTDEMSEELSRITKLAGISEGLSGTAKSSFENLDKTKLIIRHKGKVDETVPGARSRQIQSLYIENEDGERFKYPLTHLAGARAMTRHVANGGKPYDEFGQHIIQTSEDIAKLNSFSRYVANKDQLNDNAGDIIEQSKLKLENLRGYMRNLAKQSHYETASKDFKTTEAQILDDETLNKMREKFTMKNLDNRVEDALPILNKIMSELEATKEQPIEEYKDKDGNDMEPIDAPIQPPVDHGAVVQSFLTDPSKKIVLNKMFPAHTIKYAGGKKDPKTGEVVPKSKNDTLLNILSDIAARMLTKTPEEDRVANFASRVADEVADEGKPFFKPGPDYIKNKKIAIQLAKRYIDDKVEMDPADYKPKKDIKGKDKPKNETEAFESWVDNITEQKPYVSMYKDDKGKMVYDVLDKDGKSAFTSSDYEVATGFLRKNFDQLMGKMAVTKADKVLNNPAYQKMKAGDERYADKTEGMGDKIADMAQNMTRDEFMSKADELGLTPEEAAEHYEKMQGGAHAGKFEGNQFAQAVNKAKAAGMKAGDKFKVGDKEYTLKDAIELAGLQLEEFFSEEEFTMEDSDLTSAYKQIAQLASDVDENPEDAEDQWELSSEVARPITKILKQIMDYDKGEQMPDGSDMSYPDVFKKVSMLANKGAQTNDPKMAAEIFKTMSSVYDMKQVAEESVSEENPELTRIKNLAFYQ